MLSWVWACSAAIHVCSSGCPSPTQSRCWSFGLCHMHHHQPCREGWPRPCSRAEPCSTSTATSSLPHRSLPLQICGGFRVETCTPAQCEGLLCLRDNSTACGAGRPCHGIFPLSSGALAMAGEAAREFGSLSARLRETAQLVSAAALPVLQPSPTLHPSVSSSRAGGRAVGRVSCDKIPNLKLCLRLDLLDSCRNSGILEWETPCCVRGSCLPQHRSHRAESMRAALEPSQGSLSSSWFGISMAGGVGMWKLLRIRMCSCFNIWCDLDCMCSCCCSFFLLPLGCLQR